jgi:hypothetical protein
MPWQLPDLHQVEYDRFHPYGICLMNLQFLKAFAIPAIQKSPFRSRK